MFFSVGDCIRLYKGTTAYADIYKVYLGLEFDSDVLDDDLFITYIDNESSTIWKYTIVDRNEYTWGAKEGDIYRSPLLNDLINI